MMRTESQDMKEMIVVLYEGIDSVQVHDIRTDRNTQQPLQSTESECVKNRKFGCRRSVMVCLALLCVLLLTAVIVFCVLIYTNNHQCHIENKKHTEERDQLLTKYADLIKERKHNLTKYNSLTKERDEFIAKYNAITTLYDQIIKEKSELWTHIYDGWIYYRFSLYFISSARKSWSESRRYCRERGADLVIINDKKEQDFIEKISSKEIIWIGLSDSDVEGTWKWVDDSTLTSSFWKLGEPSDHRRDNCAVSFTSVWIDYSCSKQTQWICEKKKL